MEIHKSSATGLPRVLLLFAVVLASCDVSAQQPQLQADLSFALELDPGEPIAPGTTGIYTITMFNSGPDPAFPAVRLGAVTEELTIMGVRDDSCRFLGTGFTRPPPFPPFVVYSIATVDAILPGESVSCVGSYSLAADFYGASEVTWTIGVVSGGRESGPTTDPNPSNNTQRTVFGIARPVPVPANQPMSILSLVLLVIAFALAYFARAPFQVLR